MAKGDFKKKSLLILLLIYFFILLKLLILRFEFELLTIHYKDKNMHVI